MGEEGLIFVPVKELLPVFERVLVSRRVRAIITRRLFG